LAAEGKGSSGREEVLAGCGDHRHSGAGRRFVQWNGWLMASADTVTLLAVGDCGPVHGPHNGYPAGHFTSPLRNLLARADLRIANCERQYSDRPIDASRTKHGCQPSSMAAIFPEFGFDVLTLANNHMMDAGPEALLDTRDILEGLGIRVTGAGRDLTQAREPAIVESNGLFIGFLAYCSALPKGSEAGEDKVGVAALRVHTTYEDRGVQAPVRVRTKADPADLAMLLDDIRALKRLVDVVVVNLHAGVIWVPRVISDYQVEVAHACIDAGAELVLGHHPHILKGIEVYKGKTIFYSLSHLCMTKPEPAAVWSEAPWMHGALGNHNELDPDMPLLPYGRPARLTMVAKARFSADGVQDVSFVPVTIDREYRPVPASRTDKAFDEVLAYVEWSSEGLPHRFEVDGDEVRVLPGEAIAA
jgi:poly-gamma-glutamate capsule biosynthesis protein CapA/YwtB (metallophosphatase superfamily)